MLTQLAVIFFMKCLCTCRCEYRNNAKYIFNKTIVQKRKQTINSTFTKRRNGTVFVIFFVVSVFFCSKRRSYF